MGNGFASACIAVVLAALSGLSPAPVLAQEGSRQFNVPEGCTAFLTVQARSCTVSHHWTCPGDPEGTHWRVSLDEDGPFYLSFTDREFRWLRSWDLRNDISATLIEPEEDPASISELIATGSDSMVFSIRSEGPRGEARRNYTGFDQLTGDEIMVDGYRLQITEFAYQYNTPQGTREVSGTQFIQLDWRMFFGGLETTTLPSGDSVEANHSPMEFARPGERGFLSTAPIYDCGEVMSGLGAAPVWRVAQ